MNKHEARQKYLARRRELGDKERSMADNEICRLLSLLPELQQAGKVVAYVSDGCEPDLMPLLHQVVANGKKLFLPRFVVGSNAEYEMVETLLQADSLQIGKYDIMEPALQLPVTDDDLSDALWLLPGVAFDITGARLGRGKGVYDRLLGQIGASAAGIFYECQRTVKVPTDEHDYSLDIIITETGVTRINRWR